MTKKTEATPDHSQATPAGAKSLTPAEVAALIDCGSATELVAFFESQAKANLANQTLEPTKTAKALIKTCRRIRRIEQKNPDLYAAFKAGGFNLNLLPAVGTLGTRLAAAVKPTPPDRRTAKLLTPEQKVFVKAAGNRVGKAIDAAAPIARALGQDASSLGRASDVGESADSVRDAVQKVLTATDLFPLLDAAGVDDAYRAGLSTDFTKLEEILDAKEDRASDRNNQSKAIVEAQLAVELALLFFRGRSHSSLVANAAMLEEALKYLPRSPERRQAPTGGGTDDEETDDEEDGEDEQEKSKEKDKDHEEKKKTAEDDAAAAKPTNGDQSKEEAAAGDPAGSADAAAAAVAKKPASTKKVAGR